MGGGGNVDEKLWSKSSPDNLHSTGLDYYSGQKLRATLVASLSCLLCTPPLPIHPSASLSPK